MKTFKKLLVVALFAGIFIFRPLNAFAFPTDPTKDPIDFSPSSQPAQVQQVPDDCELILLNTGNWDAYFNCIIMNQVLDFQNLMPIDRPF